MEATILAPAVIQYEFPEELAARVVDAARSFDKWERSLVVDDEEIQDIRTSDDVSLYMLPSVEDEVRAVIYACMEDYNERFQSGLTQVEPVSLLRYGPGGKYVAHADTCWQVYRISSLLVYLNPGEYEGGETVFHQFGLRVKPERPSVVVFPANYAYEHEAVPVVSGEKIVVVTWMNDLPDGLDQEVIARLVDHG